MGGCGFGRGALLFWLINCSSGFGVFFGLLILLGCVFWWFCFAVLVGWVFVASFVVVVFGFVCWLLGLGWWVCFGLFVVCKFGVFIVCFMFADGGLRCGR